MTEPKHTPGPWYVLGPHPSVNVGPRVDGGCGGEYPEPPQYEPVCQVHWCPEYKTEATPEEMAIAKLIAAAPEMLAILIEQQEAGLCWDDYGIPLTMGDRINDAIGKATT
jgi:hypothetical protein